ncbi:hypothetical protein EVG20_g2039 [Dentipellis fragilis]|uniref:Mitochondrial K+-H+ exchange-related-domain-containing protein n=1 Tax=Dentipellis fragilis TaxID=205917 RepID=A0A4Y9Z946_9AGAM|nr:hypothetical protein EVG20_g2039 [Dentipellis fragilis]
MSLLPKSRLPMRIIALPLTTVVRDPKHQSDTPRPLVYYHFQTPPPPADRKVGWVDWATGKATQAWASFGKAPEMNWKYKVYRYGERLVDRIDFEELALKGVDPSLGPHISQLRRSTQDAKKEAEKGIVIPFVHPKSLSPSPLSHLRAILEKRTPRHKKGFWVWLLVSPLTAPFMLIPIIPNLPFFFCVWRSWSHYRAYKASEYLQSLLDNGAIVPKSSSDLDDIYVKHTPRFESDASESHDTKEESAEAKSMEVDEKILLRRDAVPPILKMFGLPETAAADIYRAIEQADVRLKQGIYT